MKAKGESLSDCTNLFSPRIVLGIRAAILTHVYWHPHNHLFFFYFKIECLVFSKLCYHASMTIWKRNDLQKDKTNAKIFCKIKLNLQICKYYNFWYCP